MITIDDAKPPFTCDLLHNLETDFTPERRQTGPSNPVFVFYKMLLKQKECFLSNLAQ